MFPVKELTIEFNETHSEINQDSEIETLKNDTQWLHQTRNHFGLEKESFDLMLDKFNEECNIRGKECHSSQQDLKSHFISWVNKQTKSNQKTKNGKSRNVKQRKAANVPIGKTQKNFEDTF